MQIPSVFTILLDTHQTLNRTQGLGFESLIAKGELTMTCFSFVFITVALAFTSALGADDFQPTAQEQIVPRSAQLELLWAEGEFTEGPAPDAEGGIVFSDIGNRILRFDPRTKKTEVIREPSGRANGLMFTPDGRLVACEGANEGNRRISITEKDGIVRALAESYEGKRFNSPNDLFIDADRDRLYFTDPRYGGDEPRELDFEGVFLVKLSTGEVTLATRDVQKPNGILVSSDGRQVFVADNNSAPAGHHHLAVFQVQADGTLTDKRILFDFGPNRRGIDGMTIDEHGHIFATAGTGKEAGVYVFDSHGKQLAFIATPGDPTNCVFGRGEERHSLYITAGSTLR